MSNGVAGFIRSATSLLLRQVVDRFNQVIPKRIELKGIITLKVVSLHPLIHRPGVLALNSQRCLVSCGIRKAQDNPTQSHDYSHCPSFTKTIALPLSIYRPSGNSSNDFF